MGKHMIVGVVFVLVGLSIILKAFFHVDIPVFRTAVAFFIIYIGIKMLLGSFGHHRWAHDSVSNGGDDSTILFNSGSFKWDASSKESKKYSVVFGSGVFDLSDVPVQKEDTFVEVNTVFGEGTVLLSRKTPVKIQSNAVFGE